ncbi:MAG TPA: CaiB/BaiF CoA-transferase family protein [Steroidobacteraceae bacterium]|nr:CaiB/BaiF CoA-transferase family protein [Steroidobacteraceae bacterium]
MGPLKGVRVLEVGGIGPVPFCGMILADLGAEVIRIERACAAGDTPLPKDPLQRSHRSIALNLKTPSGIATLLKLVERSEVLLEGYRPGVAERLGMGPDICQARNARLVYGRMTGWGQTGPLAKAAGHDINYISLSGALHLIGPPGGKPVPPLNLVGDFGGGGMFLAVGVLAALMESRQSGRGQVIDMSMVDGAATLLSMFFGFRAEAYFRDATGENFLAGGAPYYGTYATRDGKYVSIGSLEPQFYAILIEKLGLDPQRFGNLGVDTVESPAARARWPELREAITAAFESRTRDEWCRIFEGTDACFAPILSLDEAFEHPHNKARQTFIEVNGTMQAAPAPRFSRTTLDPPQPPRRPGEDTEAVLREIGLNAGEIAELRSQGALS